MNDRQRLDLANAVESAIMQRHGRVHGDEIEMACLYPAKHEHGDSDYSASWNRRTGLWGCAKCNEGGGLRQTATLLGIALPERETGAVQQPAARPKPSLRPPMEAPATERKLGTIECYYVYEDEDRTPLFRVVRYRDPKDFRQQQADGKGGWGPRLSNAKLVLYKLPELLASTGMAFLVEGEKDADSLRSLGFTATTSPMGASSGKSKWLPQYTEALAGRDVVIIPDLDEPGIHTANMVAAALYPAVRSIRILRLPLGDILPKHGKDVSDFIRERLEKP